MSKSLNLIKYFLYAGIFAVPFLVFIVSSSMFFPFITGKNFSLQNNNGGNDRLVADFDVI